MSPSTPVTLHDFRVAILCTDGAEEQELIETTQALEDAQAQVYVITPTGQPIFSRKDSSHQRLEDARPEDFNGLYLPSGWASVQTLRELPPAVNFAKRMHEAGRPIAANCHAPLILAQAGLVRGLCLTSHPEIQERLLNAGGLWKDQPTVLDGNTLTGRLPEDLPAFKREMMALFGRTTPDVIDVPLTA